MKNTRSEIQVDNANDESTDLIPFKYSITSYGADYPVDSLVKRLKDGSIIVPKFQREYVWHPDKASRFIESLLLGLPVPGIFLSREEESNKLLVIDGQQRLQSLLYFYEGKFSNGDIFELKNVQKNLLKKTYDLLDDEDRRKLDDSIIHATIVRQETPSEDNSSIFHIFERLNTGGVALQPQEIRSAIYRGKFNDFLERVNQNKHWRDLFGKESSVSRDKELILRFFALLFENKKYRSPMKEFLNSYMAKNKTMEALDIEKMESTFSDIVSLIHNSIGKKAFKPKNNFNAAIFDAITIGIAKNYSHLRNFSTEDIKNMYNQLLEDQAFWQFVSKSTGDEENVNSFLADCISVFSTTNPVQENTVRQATLK
jgi:Protein of unknown function DUF262